NTMNIHYGVRFPRDIEDLRRRTGFDQVPFPFAAKRRPRPYRYAAPPEDIWKSRRFVRVMRLIPSEKSFEAPRYFVGRHGGTAKFVQRARPDADVDHRWTSATVKRLPERPIKAVKAVTGITRGIAACERCIGEVDHRRDRWLTAGRIVNAVVKQNMHKAAR